MGLRARSCWGPGGEKVLSTRRGFFVFIPIGVHMASIDVVVVFRFDGITDPDSDAADAAVESLTLDLKNAGIDCDEWHIEEVLGSDPVP